MQLALAGKKVGFEKIVKMMDDMVVLLGKEQKDDDAQKDYCEAEFEKSEDESDDLKRKIKATEATIAEGEDMVEALKADIAALTTGIEDLDKAVAEATATRKEESTDYVSTKAQNSAAVQLLEVAKNQLNKFYNPTNYKPPPQQELTEEERIYVANGGVLTTAAPGGIAGTGVAAFVQLKARSDVAPPPPPMAIEAYKKSDSSGPVALLDRLMNDLKMEMKEDDMEEETAQKDYEELMAKSADKRAMMSKRIVEKEGEKAAGEERLAKAKKTDKAQKTDLMDLGEYVASLHGQCDFLIQNFDKRKDARSNEIDAIKKAKAVLSGADFTALVQTETSTTRTGGFLGKKSAEQCSAKDDEAHRMALLQSVTKLKKQVNDACVEMCKTTGSYPACNCPNFEPPDSTPGVVTWDELYDMFDSLKDEGREMLKHYTKVSSA
jgi:chromosome segregation ATPase